MNITNRTQFDHLVDLLLTEKVIVVDTETRGLSVARGELPISMSFYFPGADVSYNYAFEHGCGEFHIPADAHGADFHKLTWAGNGKKQLYKSYWFDLYRREYPERFENMPVEWLDDLRKVWARDDALYVYFNAPFDIHQMHAIGFKQPKQVEDVRIAVALAFEDWLHPSIGGENGLKWQAWRWGVEGALDGETSLKEATEELSNDLAQFIIDNIDDDMNSSFHKLKRKPRVDEVAKRIKFNPKSEMWCLPSGKVAPYAENDTKITWLLREKLRGVLEQWHQWELYKEICAAQAEVAVRLERNGILLDMVRAEELITELEPVKDEINQWFVEQIEKWFSAHDRLIEKGFLSAADEELAAMRNKLTDKKGEIAFTVGSHAKLKIVLGLLGADGLESTDREALEGWLEKHEGDHPGVEPIEKVLHYRHAERAAKTYLRNWIRSVDQNGYIHGSFNVSGTITGRWSSSSGTLGEVGNFQNIPTRGFKVKECLVTPTGWHMYQIDYSQIELRLAAWVANCQVMIDMVNEGADLHAYTRDNAGVRDILYGGLSLWEQVEKAYADGKLKAYPENDDQADKEILTYCRHVAKTLNFGLLYGGTWRMVSQLLKLPEGAARELHKAWNALYPEYEQANAYYKELGLTRRPRPDGSGAVLYVEQPLSGRCRHYGLYPVMQDIVGDDNKVYTIKTRERAAKDGFNFAVQGAAAYVMSMSALELCRMYSNDIFRPFAIIHDSLNFYLHDDYMHLLPEMIETMTDWDVNPRLSAEAEVAVDGRWQNLKAVTDFKLFAESRGTQGHKGAE
jgi:DNA polymerase I-like protein with 3'-5' exonuclease and polymerase domains